jgi:hypothetical protein
MNISKEEKKDNDNDIDINKKDESTKNLKADDIKNNENEKKFDKQKMNNIVKINKKKGCCLII